MSVYKDEIFNYLTKKDNFSSAFEIHQIFPEVKNNLIEKFWLTVKDILNGLIKDPNWEIELSDNIFDHYSSLNIWISDGFAVAFEKLHGQTYYGLWVDYKDNTLDRSQIDNYAINIAGINLMKKNNWWLGWTFLGANFDSIDTLKRILPDNRDEYAQELANQLFDFCNEVQADVLVMSKMIKK